MVQVLREDHPRLYHPADDPDYRFDLPEDEARKRNSLKGREYDSRPFFIGLAMRIASQGQSPRVSLLWMSSNIAGTSQMPSMT